MAGPDDDDSLNLETPRSTSAWPAGTQPSPAVPMNSDQAGAAPPVPSSTRTPPARKGSRRRTALLVGIGVVLVLCLIGSIAGYVTYDRATKLDRSQPYVTLYQYLEYGW